jgi:hypothetical protein
LRPIALIAGRLRFAFALKLGAIALVGVTSAAVQELTVDPYKAKPEIIRVASVQNETVIYRQEHPAQPNADQHYSEQSYTEQIEASDQMENGDTPSNFPLTVQTVRFINPGPPTDVDNMIAAPRQSIREDLIKIGGFVAYRPKEEADFADCNESTLRWTRAVSMMDQVDDYFSRKPPIPERRTPGIPRPGRE